MMIFTHILMGALFGVGVAFVHPSFVSLAVWTGIVGGAFPDLDMLFTHRRTLHFPVLFSTISILAGGISLIRPTPIMIGISCFSLAAAVHSLTDVLGGGKEMRPWRETDDRAVYNHVTQTWIKPWRVFYDGSIPDLVLSVVLAAILLVVLPTQFRLVIILLLGSGVVYTVLRRWISRQISEEYQTFSGYIQQKLRRMFDEM